MTNKANDRGSRPSPLDMGIPKYKQAIQWAVMAGCGVVVLASIHDDIRLLLQGNIELLRLLYVALFVLIMVEGAAWVQSGHHELDLSAYWLAGAHYSPPTDVTIIGSIAGIGCLIGALAVSAKWVTVFGVVYITYIAIDFIWWYVRRVNYRSAIDKARTHVTSTGGRFPDRRDVELAGIQEVEDFYLHRPHYRRCTVALVVAAITLIISLSGHVIGERTSKALAYLLFFIQILASEITIQYWRVVRDRKLRVISVQLEYGDETAPHGSPSDGGNLKTV